MITLPAKHLSFDDWLNEYDTYLQQLHYELQSHSVDMNCRLMKNFSYEAFCKFMYQGSSHSLNPRLPVPVNTPSSSLPVPMVLLSKNRKPSV